MATPISATEPGENEFEFWRYVDFQGNLYRISWKGNSDCPDLSNFPYVENCEMKVLQLSAEMTQTWRESTLLDHGVDSCIREDSGHELPILKIAHPSTIARARVDYEFRKLKELSKFSLPIPKFDHSALVDEHGIYGYRMERLYKLDFEKIDIYHLEVRRILCKMHKDGYSYGDLHPGNVMLNDRGNIVFIDFSNVGRFGDPVPSHIPSWIYKSSTFHSSADNERLVDYFPPHFGHIFE